MPDDTNKVNTLNKFIWQIYRYDSANTAFVAKKSMEISKKLGYVKGYATAQKNWAANYFITAKYKTAMELYQQSLKNFDSCHYKKGLAASYQNIGNVYYQIADWKNALKNYFKSLEIKEDIKDSLGIASVYEAIGILYANINDYSDSAIVYFNRALKIFKNKHLPFNIASIELNISNYYYEKTKSKQNKNQYKVYKNKLITHANKCIKISNKNNFLRFEATAFEILGNYYLETNQYDSAYFYLNKSLKIRKKTNNYYTITQSLNDLGKYYQKKGDVYKAKKYFLEALKLSNKIGTGQLSTVIYSNLANLSSQTKNYKDAFIYLDKYYHLKDSLENEKNIKQLTKLSMQYEFDKKQKIQELEQQKKDLLHKQQLKRQKIITSFFIFAFVLMLLLAFVIFRSYKEKQKANKLLKDKNEEITRQNAILQQQKEEILTQRDEIESQKEEIEKQRNFLDKQNQEIKASIYYAQRIQGAILTPINFFKENFKDFFVLYMPRDIVSGDFYWGLKLGNKIMITAADCTGHGVPGAFMSMLGVAFLNQIANNEFDKLKNNINAANILNKLRDMIVYALGHGIENDVQQEGMDMALAIIDYETNTMDFAGAYNPLILIHNNELEPIKPDRMPVGYHFRKMDVFFTNKKIKFSTGDKIYMFSDGYLDQFGGIEGKKFTIKKLKETLLEISSLPMQKQEDKLLEIYHTWTNPPNDIFSQIDDILIIGLELTKPE